MSSLHRLLDRLGRLGPTLKSLPVTLQAVLAAVVIGVPATGVFYGGVASYRQDAPPAGIAKIEDATVRKALTLIDRGQYDEAITVLGPDALKDPDGDSALELGLLELYLGRKDRARALLERILDAAPGYQLPADLLRAGRAARALGLFRDANSYFRDAATRAPDNAAVNTAWGDLFLEKYNKADAARSYQAAIRADANSAAAHLGLARTMAEENPPGAAAVATKVLGFDPNYPPARLLLAELALDEGRKEVARELLDRVLAHNPQHLEARALRGGMAYVDGRTADFEAEVAKALAVNPTYGDAYRIAGDLAARNYRFEEAAALVRKALALEADNVRAQADLGVHLLRTGDEDEARGILEKAFERDPYDVVTYNLLGLFDTLEKFVTVTDNELVLRMHSEEAEVLKEYAVPLAREAIDKMSARYQFKPRGPILIEIFPRHDDFAVRNVGLPGMIGALGACFGRVVTMDSPKARPPGTFDWRATLWHELAHVITLQMSNQRIPRWLTEGISVYEEAKARKVWGRDMDVEFAQAMEQGQTLKLRDLNAGFQKPQTISLAYYEASLLVEHLVEVRGEPTLFKLVRSFADGLDTDAALRAIYGVDMQGLEPAFEGWLEKRFAALRKVLAAPKDAAKGASGLDAMKLLAQQYPDSYVIQAGLGHVLQESEDVDGAVAAFERATALVPMAKGPSSPRVFLIDLLEHKGDKARMMHHLEALLEYDQADVGAARRLAALATAAGDERVTWIAYERITGLDPFDAAAHAIFGRLALKRKDADTAVRELRASLAAGSIDAAAGYCDLGEAYLMAGRPADAKRAALQALEIAPGYARAQELLLKSVETRP